MKKIFTFLLLLLQLGVAQADPMPPITRDNLITGNSRWDTAKFCPNELNAMQYAINEGKDYKAAQIALDIVEKCKVIRGTARQKRVLARPLETEAYIDAWGNALRLALVTKDDAAKKLIYNAWDMGLVESPITFDQVRGIGFVDNDAPEFFTDAYWKLFATTTDKELLKSMCYPIAYNGNDEAIQHIEERAKKETDAENKQTLGLTMAIHKWVKAGSKPEEEPPTGLSP